MQYFAIAGQRLSGLFNTCASYIHGERGWNSRFISNCAHRDGCEPGELERKLEKLKEQGRRLLEHPRRCIDRRNQYSLLEQLAPYFNFHSAEETHVSQNAVDVLQDKDSSAEESSEDEENAILNNSENVDEEQLDDYEDSSTDESSEDEENATSNTSENVDVQQLDDYQQQYNHRELERLMPLPPTPSNLTFLGQGAVATVNLIRQDAWGREQAVARKGFHTQEDFLQELAALRRLHSGFSHPCLLKMVGYNMVDWTIDTEYMERGSLHQLLLDQTIEPMFQFIDVWGWLMDILSATEYMNSVLDLVHLDIKPQNILLDHSFNAVLCDIGTINEFPFGLNRHAETDLFTPPEARSTLHNPAVRRASKRSFNYDVFSIGCVMVVCLWSGTTIQETYANLQETINIRKDLDVDERFELSFDVPPDFLTVLNCMLEEDAEIRPPAAGVLALPAIDEFRRKFINTRWQRGQQYLWLESENQKLKRMCRKMRRSFTNNIKLHRASMNNRRLRFPFQKCRTL